MKPHRNTTGLLLLVVLAAVGVLLMLAPFQFASLYDQVKEAGQPWVTIYFTAVGLGGAILLGCSGWIVWTLWRRTIKKRTRRVERDRNPSQLTAEEREQEIEENLASVRDFEKDEAVDDELRRELAPLSDELEEKRASKVLEIVAFGTISSGKSSLLNLLAGRDMFRTDVKGGTTVRRNEVPWPGMDKVVLVDTPGLGEVDGAVNINVSAKAAQNADLVLMVVDGPLKDSEHRLLSKLGEMEKRALICLNKEDWYGEEQKQSLLEQLREQVKEIVAADDVLAVRARPAVRTRMRVLPAGEEVEETVEAPADISALAGRMMQVVRRDGSDLLLANLLLQSRGLVEEAKGRVQASLDRRAWQIVDRYMWGAGGAAALSPWPLVDLAAGCVISAKMVVDLARVYRQDVDMDMAVNLLGQMGKQLIAVVGTSAATPAVAAVVASMLKTVPGIGTIAGGLLQGIVQALVTRWIGAVFIGYLANEMQAPEGGLAALARREWQKITSVGELRKLVRQARDRLSGKEEDED